MVALRRRVVVLVVALIAADLAVAVVACSTSAPDTETADGSADGQALDAGGKDGALADAREGGGNCSPANSACDLVRQNCPDKQECVVTSTGKTKCQATQASQQLPMGRACCPNGGVNPCLPGLMCAGLDCVDGGPISARCSPACCKGNDQACGKSDPEGISGACDITLVDNTGAPLLDQCTYRERCKPFKIEPCKAGEACIVSDKVGTASCILSSTKTNRQPCTFGNECVDGLTCLNGANQCRTVCLIPGEASPFDASVAEAGAGQGGCPPGERCLIKFNDAPEWYGACSFPDGG